MKIEICKICGDEFSRNGRTVTCSPECKKENIKRAHNRANKKYRKK